jgi:hypothetical protein
MTLHLIGSPRKAQVRAAGDAVVTKHPQALGHLLEGVPHLSSRPKRRRPEDVRHVGVPVRERRTSGGPQGDDVRLY